MAETKEDMKITKFKIMIEEIHKYLQGRNNGGSYNLLSYYPPFIDKYIGNEYVQVIRKQLMCTPAEIRESSGKVLRNELEYIHTATTLYRKLICVINRSINNKLSGNSLSKAEFERDSYALVFWLFFLAAIDEELYNNELSSIIDFAYCLKFDEPMIRDWCHAVKYVLEGNHLNENCDLQCTTEVGKKFFLHQ